MKVAVIGAGGFVGQPVTRRLLSEGVDVRPIVRTPGGLPGERTIADVDEADWDALLEGMDAVIHLIARVHIVNDRAENPLADNRRINTAGTLKIAEAAARAGVKRFVFVSTVKVNGENNIPSKPFTADEEPTPLDAYGISKREAELGLLALSERTGMEVTVVRPPLVYGPRVRANFLSMMKLVRRGVPLPFGRVTGNRRSMVGIDNLVDLIVTLLRHKNAPGQIFFASDGHDVSTRELLSMLAAAMGRKARLVPMPVGLMRAAAKVAGKGATAQRVLGSLQVDITKTRQLLDWTPPVSVEEGLRRTVTADWAD
jgi:nucleoside-diphosphate-sugar epimerase